MLGKPVCIFCKCNNVLKINYEIINQSSIIIAGQLKFEEHNINKIQMKII